MVLPFVTSIPHCAARVPPELAGDLALSSEEVAESVDLGTAEVFGDLPVVACLQAQWSRLVVDLNRDPAERGEKGVVALRDYFDRPVFRPGREPDEAEIRRRVERYHRPYHQALRQALSRPEVQALLDCHSLDGVGPAGAPDPGRRRSHVVLGDAMGQSCTPAFRELVRAAFTAQGLTVSFNRPYAGGYITRHYGLRLRAQGRQALQIELNKDLFLDSSGRLDPRGLERTRRKVHAALAQVAAALLRGDQV